MSVVLTTCNRVEMVGATIASIRAQTYRDWELIVADDASSDGTFELVNELCEEDDRMRVLRQPTNLGMPANLNVALAECRGELIANLHDGDLYSPDLLAEWVAALDRCPRAAFVFNPCREVGLDGRLLRTFEIELPDCAPGTELLKQFYRRWRFNSPVWGTVMARRSAYEEAGPFDERFAPLSDVDMWMRLAERHWVAHVPKALITLPSRSVLPSRFAEVPEQAKIAEQLFWESRMRAFTDRPLRRSVEVLRHGAHLVIRRAYDGALALRRTVRRRTGRG